MSVEHGKVSTKGPGDEEDWTVYLLVRTPKFASIDLETMNGPISLYDVDGKVTARAHNGPISLKNFSGDAEITAVNGPISLDGSSGSVRIRTENGPISVALGGKTWSGTGLSAMRRMAVDPDGASGYQSSFVVESRNHSPVSCERAFAKMREKPGTTSIAASNMAAHRR